MAQIRNEVLIKKISLRVKKLREAKGITQEDFFNDTTIHIGRIETGKHNITVSTLEGICRYFKISLEAFFREI